MNVSRSTIKLFFSYIGRTVLSFAVVAYFSRELGAGNLGTFFLFQSTLSFAVMPADLGLRTGIEKQMSEGGDRREVLGSALVAKTVLILPIVLVLLLARNPVMQYFGADVAPVLAIAILLQEVGKTSIAGLRGEKRVGETAIFDPLRTTVWGVMGALLAMLHYEAFSLIYGFIFGLASVAVIGWWRLDTLPGRPSMERIRSLVNYSKYVFVGQVGGIVYNWLDVIILGFFVSNAIIGAYEVAWRIAAVPLLLSQAIRRTIFPEANSYTGNVIPKLESLIEDMITPSLYLLFPALVGVVVLGESILRFGFGTEFGVASLALVFLMVEKLHRGFSLILIAPMHAIDRPDLAAVASIGGMLTNLVLNLLLIPTFGIIGAAIGTSIGAILNTAIQAHFLRKYMKIRVHWDELSWLLLGSALMGGCLAGLIAIRPPSSLLDTVLYVGIGGGIYVLSTAAVPKLRTKMIWSTKQVFG